MYKNIFYEQTAVRPLSQNCNTRHSYRLKTISYELVKNMFFFFFCGDFNMRVRFYQRDTLIIVRSTSAIVLIVAPLIKRQK